MTRIALEGYVLDVGFSNTVPAHRVTGIMSYDSEPYEDIARTWNACTE